jgi:glycosyl transferase family 25
MIAEVSKTQTPYEIVAAVDGRELDLADERIVDPAADSTFRPGMVGCVLSHLAVYRRIIDSGAQAAIVLEDDVVLPADLDSLVAAVAQQMTGAEVVLFNFHLYEACLAEQCAISLPGGRLLVQVVDRGSPWSGAAYVITREACERLVKAMRPVRARADYWALFYREGSIDRVRCVVPTPVANSVTLRTTKDNLPPDSVQARLWETVTRARVPVLHQALALRRRRHLQRYKTGRAQFVAEPPPGAEPLPLLWRDPHRMARE